MIGDILQPTHLIFVLVVALLVLGPKRLPEVGRSLGRGLRDFRSALSGEEHDEVPAETPPVTAPPVQPAEPAQSSEPVAGAQVAEPAVHADEIAPAAEANAAEPAPEPTAEHALSEQPEHVA